MLKYCMMAGFLLASASAAAEGNIFNADMSNPDLSAAISSFEQVCMPFVLHETELARKDDWRHTTGLMKNLGFASNSIVTRSRRVEIEPSRVEWKPPSRAITSSHVLKNTKQFTVFNGVSSQAVTDSQTIISKTGEINMRDAYIPPLLKTVTYQVESYTKETEPRLAATLDWNYPSQKDPGKSCAITLDRANIKPARFVEAFIARDEKWTAMPNEDTSQKRWSQCVSDADNDFEFTAEYSEDTISISMKRSDFYAPKLCHH